MKTSKLVCAWAATLVIAVTMLPLSQDSHAQQGVVLTNVNVIDGTGAPAQPNSNAGESLTTRNGEGAPWPS